MPKDTPSRTLRKQLAAAIIARLELTQQTQAEAAEMLGIPRPRLSAVRNGDVDLISLDKLVDAAENLGLVVRISVTRPWGQSRD